MASTPQSGAVAARPSWGAIVALAAVLAFGFLGSRGLWDTDEGRYVETAREMVVSGNWLYPQLHGVPHFTKPPLTYWAIAAGLSAFGTSEWAARAFLGLAFGATIVLLSAFGEALAGSKRGRWAGPIHGTMLFPFAAGSIVTADTLLVLWEVGALYAYWRHRSSPGSGRAAAVLLWICLGAGFLTKGPPALLPLLVIVPFAALCREAGPRGRWAWIRPEGIAAFVAVGVPWYLVVAHGAPGLLRYLVEDEVVRRVATSAHDRNAQWYKPFTLYLPALTVGLLPWAAYWPSARTRVRAWRGLRDRPRALLLSLWVVLPVVLFALVRSRQPLYVLPVVPALALATALLVRDRPYRRLAATVAIAAVALLGLRGYAAGVDHRRDARALAEWVRPHLAGGPAEIVVINDNVHGLEFYLDVPVELVRWDEDSDPRYRHLPDVDDELAELPRSPYRHVYLLKADLAEAFAGRLREAGVDFRDGGGRHGERVVIVDAVAEPPDGDAGGPAVAIVWDGPGSEVDRIDRARAIEEFAEIDGIAEVVVLQDDALGAGHRHAGVDQAAALWRLDGFRVPVRVREIGGDGPWRVWLSADEAIVVRREPAGLSVWTPDGAEVGVLAQDAPLARLESFEGAWRLRSPDATGAPDADEGRDEWRSRRDSNPRSPE